MRRRRAEAPRAVKFGMERCKAQQCLKTALYAKTQSCPSYKVKTPVGSSLKNAARPHRRETFRSRLCSAKSIWPIFPAAFALASKTIIRCRRSCTTDRCTGNAVGAAFLRSRCSCSSWAAAARTAGGHGDVGICYTRNNARDANRHTVKDNLRKVLVAPAWAPRCEFTPASLPT